ncbi:UDP-N-acetylmuramoyl-tripeptide--D-alanyl-D-alanine ligase [Aliiglaciecola sp. CAU 1673]|uniref:UDP-N-acetylmuramoyl-tripeptide--D-alanyl-D- alanine ligase n=1 Tax=Aliiglaciecola sp. CAU 1673 TaxID=3032595 RepID=UPI0023DC9DF9|nr:UDP-N-acetylmuramoyl-tripeptide--D-alanyl-D-alanine ligase [Aliiglaciecola sp. CAU 1673]MDF2178436.1 UDP-N-acetylmuramoyl-tripeptide--D-alanyl-D-alanine ligase [Aliiglaciecola sp. CAU 1673]
MISVDLNWIATKLKASLQGENRPVGGVSTDTRTIKPGDLFVALSGPNFDGHAFAQVAKEKGACAMLVSQPVEIGLPTILVDDTKLALGQLAAAVRDEVPVKTVAITGSSGKTTVKEMVASILSRKGKVLATQGNFNNDIGVPLTLLRLEADHDYAVIELGANHLGEIAYTTSLTKPDAATIVNAAAAHLEGFGSLFGVARAKSEIFKGLPAGGLAVLNGDSQFLQFWQGKLHDLRIQTFSEKQGDFRASDVILGLDGCAEFEMHTPLGSIHLSLAVPGMHNVANALCAAALAMEVGASLEDVKMGLQQMAQVKGRLNIKQLTNQIKVIDDSYNANVASTQAAIDLLASFSGRRVLVLGDMAELGEKARFYHEEIGQYAKTRGIDNLVSLGVLSQQASDQFEEAGRHFGDVQSVIAHLESLLLQEQRDITILVKGSRSARMERVVSAIEASPLGKLERYRERIAC